MPFIFIPCFHNCQIWVIFRVEAHFQRLTRLTYDSFQTEHNWILFLPPLVLFTKVITVFFALNKIIDSYCLNGFWSPFSNHLRVIFPRYSWPLGEQRGDHSITSLTEWVMLSNPGRIFQAVISKPGIIQLKMLLNKLYWNGGKRTLSCLAPSFSSSSLPFLILDTEHLMNICCMLVIVKCYRW